MNADTITDFVASLDPADLDRLLAAGSERRDADRTAAWRSLDAGVATHRISIDRLLTGHAADPAIRSATRLLESTKDSRPTLPIWQPISVAQMVMEDRIAANPDKPALRNSLRGLHIFAAIVHMEELGIDAIDGVILDGHFSAINPDHGPVVVKLGRATDRTADYAHPITDHEGERQ